MATTLSPNDTIQAPPISPSRPRLHYLDSIRGLAALIVVCSHIHRDVLSRADAANLPHWFGIFGWMYWGRYPVDVFIVLSGYCLMLPVAQSAAGKLRGGALDYLKRRARRILPPYYAALAISLVLTAIVPGLLHPTGGTPTDAIHTQSPAFTAPAILSHVFLIQNLREGWFFKINGPTWSVATEWQIYFFFPLLLLPVWRKFGLASAVGAGVLFGWGVHFGLHRKFDLACPWFLALFAMGMAGAVVNFGAKARSGGERRNIPWGGISAAGVLLVAVLSAIRPTWTEDHFYLVDLVAGAATASLLIACTRGFQRDHATLPLGLRLLDSRPLVGLGVFSYSTYLLHRPLLLSMEALYTRAHFNPITEFWVLLFAGVPIIIGITYLFHLVFERRFMNIPPKAVAR